MLTNDGIHTIHLCAYRFGSCVPYPARDQSIPCDALYTPGVDHIFVSYRRTGGNIDRYLDRIEVTAGLVLAVFRDECQDAAVRVLCQFFLPPCGNSTIFEPPTSVCMEACNYLRDTCPTEWDQVIAIFEENDSEIRPYGANFINCRNTGEYLNPLPHCCSDVGVDICMSSSVVIGHTNKQ